MTVPDSDMSPTYRVACSDVRRALMPMSELKASLIMQIAE